VEVQEVQTQNLNQTCAHIMKRSGNQLVLREQNANQNAVVVVLLKLNYTIRTVMLQVIMMDKMDQNMKELMDQNMKELMDLNMKELMINIKKMAGIIRIRMTGMIKVNNHSSLLEVDAQ
jgi:hypothetical protein